MVRVTEVHIEIQDWSITAQLRGQARWDVCDADADIAVDVQGRGGIDDINPYSPRREKDVAAVHRPRCRGKRRIRGGGQLLAWRQEDVVGCYLRPSILTVE